MTASLQRRAHPRGAFFFIGNFGEISYEKKREASQLLFLEATTRFELVIRVLQTHALPLGYVAIFYCDTEVSNDPNQIRTGVTAVKGRCLNRLTMGPY